MIVGPFQALTPEFSETIKKHYPYSVRLGVQWLGRGRLSVDPVDEWCEERFGWSAKRRDDDWDDDGRYMAITYTLDLSRVWLRRVGMFHFQNENHAFEFKMRWG